MGPFVSPAPSFGDLNGVGKPEVLVQTSSQLYVGQSDGTPLSGFLSCATLRNLGEVTSGLRAASASTGN